MNNGPLLLYITGALAQQPNEREVSPEVLTERAEYVFNEIYLVASGTPQQAEASLLLPILQKDDGGHCVNGALATALNGLRPQWSRLTLVQMMQRIAAGQERPPADSFPEEAYNQLRDALIA